MLVKNPKIRSVDIDDLEDWKIAEAFYEKNKFSCLIIGIGNIGMMYDYFRKQNYTTTRIFDYEVKKFYLDWCS